MNAALLSAALCLGTAAFNMAVALGAPWGHLTQGGFSPGVLPPRGRLLALVSVALLVAAALAMGSQAGLWPGWPRWAGWVAVALIAFSLVMNAITPSRPERRLWVPIIGLNLACALWAMLAGVNLA